MNQPDMKALRPSQVIAAQRVVIKQQEEMIDVLKGALAAGGVEHAPTLAPWMIRLTRQERALIGALYSKYPQAVPREAILELLPGRDHACERQLQIVDVTIHRLRKKLGPDAVVTDRGVGFRMGGSFYERVPKDNTVDLMVARA